MQRIILEDGIKTSLASIINKSQDIFEGNYREIVSTLYVPGLFIGKKSNGSLEDDFKPEIVNDESENPTLLKINIRGKNPARAYVNTGKIISLNDSFIFSPLGIKSINITSNGIDEVAGNAALPGSPKDYTVWLVPKDIEKEPQDYLPNYIVDGQTKNLVKEYIADFIAITMTTGKNINVEGIKLCKVTVGTDGSLTDLVDYRLTNRAYIKPELYDFFIASYLKHDFILTHADDDVNTPYLTFTSDYKLSGSFLLLGGKSQTSKIRATCSNLTVPLNSVLYITISENDFFDTGVLTKTISVTPIADFIPTSDIVVLGYHLKTEIPSDGDPSVE